MACAENAADRRLGSFLMHRVLTTPLAIAATFAAKRDFAIFSVELMGEEEDKRS